MESDVVKSFAKATGDFDLLTELDFILMGIVYDIEREKNGVDHINQTPLLDVPLFFLPHSVEKSLL